jgi:hypothetical protein
VLIDDGFRRAVSSPVAFYHPGRDVRALVHGDDFVFNGLDEELDGVLKLVQKHYEIKNRGRLGSGPNDVREIDILGRVVRLREWGWSWEADGRHRQAVMKYFGLDEDSKALIKNGYKEEATIEGEPEVEGLSPEEQRNYRALAARVNYIAQDNPCVQFSAKEACRRMANPTVPDFQKMKKLAHFMVGLKDVKFCYEWQSEEEACELEIFVDSDWAGCVRTRRSTSGGIARLGKHTLRTWSTTQPTVAMSSAEAEYYEMTEGATHGIGLCGMLGEMGVNVSGVALYTDSSAAKSFASRRGVGKLRHICLKELWLQEVPSAQDRRRKEPGRPVDEVPGHQEDQASEPAFRFTRRHSADGRCRGGVLVIMTNPI